MTNKAEVRLLVVDGDPMLRQRIVEELAPMATTRLPGDRVVHEQRRNLAGACGGGQGGVVVDPKVFAEPNQLSRHARTVYG